MLDNIILLTDSYKQSHWKMQVPKLEYLHSYFEARSGGEFAETVFFGLQYLVNEYLSGVRVNQQMINEARAFCQGHFGTDDIFNLEGWQYILDKHEGRLPVQIRAVPEGTVVPESNVLLTIQNTDPNCAWLTNHLETILVQLWYPSTVATGSRELKKMLRDGLARSGSPEKLPFMLHDFGYRGSTSMESAALGGASHLVNFMGTDTIAGIELLMNHYNSDMPGFSVPAAEHSTITAWGEDAETDAYRHILNRFKIGLVSVVSDSWDIFNACENIWGRELRDDVICDGRTVVVRPDSGDPKTIVVRCLNLLGQRFGYEYNSKGYMVLPEYVRLIQGDGISRYSLPEIVDSIILNGWSLDNIVFGSGGGLLQDYNRDTSKYAMKCSYVVVNGEGRDVYKRPASDPGKNSKRGMLKLVEGEDGFETVGFYENDKPDVMREVFRNGEVLIEDSLDLIRERTEVN